VRKAASGGSAPKEAKDVFSPSLIWFRRLLVLAAVVVGATASAAGASGIRATAAPDVFERYAAAHPYGSAVVPDVLERYAAAHPYGAGVLRPALGTERIVDDSFRDPTPIVTPAGDRIVDDSFRDQPLSLAAPTGDRIVDDSFRDPTPIVTPAGDRIVDDSFRDAPTVVVSPASGNSLDWADFGIGAGAMLGLTVLLTGLGVGAVAVRHRGGRLETS
jgi:hypothetical protein